MGTRSKAAAAVLALACSGAFAGPAEDAQAAFSEFFKLFVSRNHAQVAALFAPGAQFYGTNSMDLVTTPDGVLKYFTGALDNPVPVQARPIGLTATALSDTVVLVAGSWVSERTVDGKLNSSGPLRMTAVMQKRGDRWAVVQFHNSRQPAPPAAAPQTPASR
ncbi:nuclear transport factor 2 family protein [Ramlibacter albus]|uniref:Nuclear transport factor 2 family protein n=1 Tax=Ramlibacter albus TaxID=2079448 RepID=A0A923S5G5_9BURK|nr:nuclear transport factor 2 family protein [Ramlibacter albus]MBC5767963.1 nuclear transport factor 2 family protein [Ramlibacter albus]